MIFSAATVAAALASLLVFPQRFLYSMGVGGVLVTVVAALVSLVFLPALLAALGPRVNALSPKRWRRAVERDAAAEHEGFWYRHSRRVMRRPGAIAARHRGAADRARAAVHRDQVHRRRCERARHVALGARGRRRAAGGVPAQPDVARDRRRAGAGVGVGRGGRVRAAAERDPRRARGAAAAGGRRPVADRRRRAGPAARRVGQGHRARRARGAGAVPGAGRRRRRRSSSTSSRRWPTGCRWRWPSSR